MNWYDKDQLAKSIVANIEAGQALQAKHSCESTGVPHLKFRTIVNATSRDFSEKTGGSCKATCYKDPRGKHVVILHDFANTNWVCGNEVKGGSQTPGKTCDALIVVSGVNPKSDDSKGWGFHIFACEKSSELHKNSNNAIVYQAVPIQFAPAGKLQE